MVAKDIMTTQVMTVQSTTSVHDAMKMLVEIEISGLIVTDADNNIEGVVTERDLLVAYDLVKQTKAPISEYINRKVVGINEDTPVEEISRVLIQGDVRRVPVLRGKKVVGVVSRRDLLKNVLKQEDKRH